MTSMRNTHRWPWWALGSALIALVAASTLLLVARWGMKVNEAATTVTSLITATGVLLAYRTLLASHEWNRRHYTIELMGKWNTSARTHIAFLEHEFPDFFVVPDFLENNQVLAKWKLDSGSARQLCALSNLDSHSLEIRDHLIELFNYFEDLSIAYEQHVVSRSPVEDSFGPVIIDTYVYFQPFVDEMRKLNRRDPWPPLSRVVQIWLTSAKVQRFQSVQEQNVDELKKALKKYGKDLRPPPED